MPERIETVGVPVIGLTYLVPSIMVRRRQEDPYVAAPVIGDIHHDAEIGEPRVHVHFDERFLTDEMVILVARVEDDGKSVSQILNDTILVAYFRKPDGTRVHKDEPDRPLFLGDTAVYREFTCIRTTPRRSGHPGTKEQYNQIERQMLKCVARGFCPHRGMPLQGVPRDADGVVTCPGHLLRWDAQGKLVPRTIASTEGCSGQH